MRIGSTAFFVGTEGGVLMKKDAIHDRKPTISLTRAVAEFINHKHSLGFKYIIEENILHRFSRLGQKYDIRGNTVPPSLIEEWFKRQPNEKATTFYSRCFCVKRFLQFAVNFGYRSEIPEIPACGKSTYVPYIFSEDEITRFFHACDAMPWYTGTLRHIIVPVVFRLLYSCGLRVSEAIGLKKNDVDLSAGVLTIREPKNRQDRYVPMSPSMTSLIRTFSLLEHPCVTEGTDNFFTSKYNGHLTRYQVYHWFRLCLEKAGITHRGKGFGPREHDLRHTFCVRSLQSLCLQGFDLYCFLPWLSTYVGHKSIQATQQYLRLTADVYPDLIGKVTTYCGYVIPETKEESRHETD
jgi:site-specific recombinase XerD